MTASSKAVRPTAFFMRKEIYMVITHKIQQFEVEGDHYVELSGLSTDDKPLDVAESSLFFEVDTGDIYYFDGSDWNKVGGSGLQ